MIILLWLINITFLNSKLYQECTDIPSIGLIAVKSDVVKEYVGTILKDLPFLSR